MGRRLVTIAVMTVALSAVGVVMAASGAPADPTAATFTIQLSGGRRGLPDRPRDLWWPGHRHRHHHHRPQRPDPVLCDHHPERGPAAAVPRTCLTGLDKNLLKDILRNPLNYYVNVHNAPFPSGAVRGQLA
jgi:hypothetical protein